MRLTFSKQRGTGDSGAITMGLESTYGGNQDVITNVTIASGSGNASATIKVVTKGYPLFNNIALHEYTVNNAGGTLTISGYSNESDGFILDGDLALSVSEGKLVISKFEVDDNTLDVSVHDDSSVTFVFPENYGANDSFQWKLTLEVPENKTITAKTYHFAIAGLAGSYQDDITVGQAEGDDYVYVNLDGESANSHLDIEFDNVTKSTNFYVMSNTSWIITYSEPL